MSDDKVNLSKPETPAPAPEAVKAPETKMSKGGLIVTVLSVLFIAFCVINFGGADETTPETAPEATEAAEAVKQADAAPEAAEAVKQADAAPEAVKQADADKPGAGYVKPDEAALKAMIGDADCRDLKTLPDDARWPCAQLWYWYWGGFLDVYEAINKALLEGPEGYRAIQEHSWNIDVKNARLTYTPPAEQDPKFTKIFGIDENYHVWVDYSVMFEDCEPNPKYYCISDATAHVRINLKTGKILPLDTGYIVHGGFKPRKK